MTWNLDPFNALDHALLLLDMFILSVSTVYLFHAINVSLAINYLIVFQINTVIHIWLESVHFVAYFMYNIYT